MSARVENDASPVARMIQDIIKYRQKNSGDISMVASCATELQNYAKGEEDKKKKAGALKIAKGLTELSNSMTSDYNNVNKKLQLKIREIQKICK